MNRDCLLIIGIYSEDGNRLIMSRTSAVKSSDTAVGVVFDEEMPEYYLVRALLTDPQDGHALCTEFESIEHTKAWIEFDKLTTDDFDPALVVNFDDNKTNNFSILHENVIYIQDTAEFNEVVTADDTNNTYVIKNADSAVKSLKAGDKLCYRYGSVGMILTEVASVSVSGDTVTVNGKAGCDMSDFFSMVKINAATDTRGVTFYEEKEEIIEDMLSENPEDLAASEEYRELLFVDEDSDPSAEPTYERSLMAYAQVKVSSSTSAPISTVIDGNVAIVEKDTDEIGYDGTKYIMNLSIMLDTFSSIGKML